MDKFFSDKSKAKSRGLAKIGEIDLAAADYLLFKGEDGRWGFDIETAEAVQNYRTRDGRNPWVTELPVANGTVTTVVNGRKHVSSPAKKDIPEPKKETATRPSYKGYTIDKDRPRQNGVTRPSAGTLCGQVWAALEAIQEKNGVVTSADLPALAEANSWNRNNVSCEFYNWRKFMGIKGRTSK